MQSRKGQIHHKTLRITQKTRINRKPDENLRPTLRNCQVHLFRHNRREDPRERRLRAVQSSTDPAQNEYDGPQSQNFTLQHFPTQFVSVHSLQRRLRWWLNEHARPSVLLDQSWTQTHHPRSQTDHCPQEQRTRHGDRPRRTPRHLPLHHERHLPHPRRSHELSHLDRKQRRQRPRLQPTPGRGTTHACHPQALTPLDRQTDHEHDHPRKDHHLDAQVQRRIQKHRRHLHDHPQGLITLWSSPKRSGWVRCRWSRTFNLAGNRSWRHQRVRDYRSKNREQLANR